MKKRRRILAILGVFILLAGSCQVYAGTIAAYRSGYLDLSIPEEWTINEVEPEINTADSYEYENILFGYSDADELDLYMYYIAEEISDGNTESLMGSKDSAMKYYYEYADSMLDVFMSDIEYAVDYEVDSVNFYSGDFEDFVKVKILVEYENYNSEIMAYISGKTYSDGEKLVHNMMILYPYDDDLSVTDITNGEAIISSFEDYDYGKVLLGIETLPDTWKAQTTFAGDEWEDEEEESDSGFDFGLILTILVPVIGLLSVFNKGKDDDEEVESQGNADEDLSGKLAEKLKQAEERQAERKLKKAKKTADKKAPAEAEKRSLFKKATDDRQIMKERSAKVGQSRKTVTARPVAPKTNYHQQAEQRYIASLETLRKSGLLTKEEMQEMMDKHRRL